MFWTAFLFGLFGGLHCVAMCGPISLALPIARSGRLIASRILYNSGRVVTYASLGGIAGLIGTSVEINLVQAQQYLSIAAGTLLILIVIASGFRSLDFSYGRPFVWISGKLKTVMGRVLKRSSLGASMLTGIANGFLPCGLVYVALAASLAAGGVRGSILYMIMFGLGTFPLMLALSLSKAAVPVNIRSKLTRMVPVFVFVVGVLFILRGLELGIPYVSPMPVVQGQFETCEP